PGQNETKEHDKEEGTPEIPIPQRLPWIFPIRIREHNKLQITDNPRQISLHSIPNRLRKSIRRGSEPVGGDVLAGGRRQSGDGGDNDWKRRFLGRRRREVGLDERGGGDGDGGAWRAGRAGWEDGGWACLDGAVD
ncbi:hypothetical protein Dimus_002430, partial [Dionaea muscipula]